MKKFEINFRGNPIAGGGPGNNFEAWFKMEGDPIEIGRALGEFADGLIRQRKDYTLAKILMTAVQVFLLKNPGMTAEELHKLANEQGIIVSPFKA
jgi:hypothetical protein